MPFDMTAFNRWRMSCLIGFILVNYRYTSATSMSAFCDFKTTARDITIARDTITGFRLGYSSWWICWLPATWDEAYGSSYSVAVSVFTSTWFRTKTKFQPTVKLYDHSAQQCGSYIGSNIGVQASCCRLWAGHFSCEVNVPQLFWQTNNCWLLVHLRQYADTQSFWCTSGCTEVVRWQKSA